MRLQNVQAMHIAPAKHQCRQIICSGEVLVVGKDRDGGGGVVL